MIRMTVTSAPRYRAIPAATPAIIRSSTGRLSGSGPLRSVACELASAVVVSMPPAWSAGPRAGIGKTPDPTLMSAGRDQGSSGFPGGRDRRDDGCVEEPEPTGWMPPRHPARTAEGQGPGRRHFGRRPRRRGRGHHGGPLRRPREDRLVGGVAAGLAARIGRDVTTVRIIIVVAAVLSGGFFAAAYVVAWMLIPMEGAQGNIPRKARTDRRGLALGAVCGAPVVTLRILVSVFSVGWLSSFFWPLAIAGAGLILIWRNADKDEQAMVQNLVQPVAGLTAKSRRAGFIIRLTVAVILLVSGITALQSAHENIALLKPLAGVALLISAIVVLLGPWWLRIARDLVVER